MIGRILWVTAIIAVAIVTIAVQLDRQSRVSPALAGGVPEPFRGFAQAHITAAALRGDDSTLALNEAEILVRRRPIPAEHLRLLTIAQAKADQTEASVLTVQIAARRGWRDALAQEAMLELALGAEDYPEAARRYAAMFLNNQTEDAKLVSAGARIFAEPGGSGRQTFSGIVADGARWRGFFLNRGPRVLPGDAFVEIVKQSRERGAQFDCGVMDRADKILSNGDDTEAAEAFRSMIAEQC